jgi:hypothetical protein
MRYLAVVESSTAVLEHYIDCFNSDICRITKLDGKWALSSSAFDACSSPAKVFPLADAMLFSIRRILSLYNGLSSPVTVSFIEGLDENGRRVSTTIREQIIVNIVSQTASAELSVLVGGNPLGAVILEALPDDIMMREALQLYQDLENRWSDIYDIIEFLGGPEYVERVGVGTRKECRRIRQTANYFRHLGSPRAYLLPPNPPTANEAAQFAKRSLRRWIELRLEGTTNRTSMN